MQNIISRGKTERENRKLIAACFATEIIKQLVGKYSRELLYRNCQINKKQRRGKKREYGSLHFLPTVIRVDPMTHFTGKPADSRNGRIMSMKSNRTQVGGQRTAALMLRDCYYHTSLPPRIFSHSRISYVSFQLSPKLKHITPGRETRLPSHTNFSGNITETNA